MTTKSDQTITELEVTLTEKWSTGRGDQKQTKEFKLGQMKLPAGFAIKPGDMKEIPFELPFKMINSENDKYTEQGGVLGGLGKIGAFADAEHSTYRVVAAISAKGVVIPATDGKDIKFV